MLQEIFAKWLQPSFMAPLLLTLGASGCVIERGPYDDQIANLSYEPKDLSESSKVMIPLPQKGESCAGTIQNFINGLRSNGLPVDHEQTKSADIFQAYGNGRLIVLVIKKKDNETAVWNESLKGDIGECEADDGEEKDVLLRL